MVLFKFVVCWLNLCIEVVYILVFIFGKMFNILCLFVKLFNEILVKLLLINVKFLIIFFVCGKCLLILIGLFVNVIVIKFFLFI